MLLNNDKKRGRLKYIEAASCYPLSPNLQGFIS